jgi:SAM-dependent methyltransferase
LLSTLLSVVLAAQPLGSATGPAVQRPAPLGDVPFVPTPPEVVELMLRLGEVRSGDVVYDLGCGDGRIVIAAVKIPGVRGVCVDIDPARIEDSRINAERAGVAGRIRFVEGDLFEVPIEGATVVMIYLLPQVNLRLRPRLLSELRPGTRVISHMFDMGDWKPQRQAEIDTPQDHHVVYRWIVPMQATHRPRRPRH